MLIFYVDDDSDDREMLSDAVKLIDSQISCLLFESGQELLNFLGTSKTLPDYIFIDINMPKMNGYECAQLIRSNNGFGQIQIVMYSTAFNPKDVVQFTQLGYRFLTKPNKFNDLVEFLKDLIA